MKRVLGGLMAMSLFLSIAGQARAEFTFTTLDVPGAVETIVNGINNSGQMAQNWRSCHEPPSGDY
jgi:hypothetical protein